MVLLKQVLYLRKNRELYRSIADKIFLQGMQYAEPSVPKKIKSAYYAVSCSVVGQSIHQHLEERNLRNNYVFFYSKSNRRCNHWSIN